MRVHRYKVQHLKIAQNKRQSNNGIDYERFKTEMQKYLFSKKITRLRFEK